MHLFGDNKIKNLATQQPDRSGQKDFSNPEVIPQLRPVSVSEYFSPYDTHCI